MLAEIKRKKGEKRAGRFPVLVFVSGMLWGITLAFVAGVIYLRHSLVLEYESPYGFEKTISVLSARINGEKGWKVMTGGGCPLPNPSDESRMTQLKLCHLKYALALLDDPDSRKTAAFIPCTFAVYEDGRGGTRVSRMNVDLLGLILGGRSGEIFPRKVSPEQKRMLDVLKVDR